MSRGIQGYYALCQEVDALAARLEPIHREQMQCQKGCVDCCMNLTVWPVEFFAIAQEVKAAGVELAFDELAGCGFLKDGLCRIYPFRPIICRTHGLPLVYLEDEQDEPAYGVTFCQKNFQEADDIEFGPDNTLYMDEINERLAGLQAEFAETDQTRQVKRDANGRIALRELVNVK